MVSEIARTFEAWANEYRPALVRAGQAGMLVLHGSLTRDITDGHADFDLWLLVPDAALAEYDQAEPTRFVELPTIAGRPGHVSVESIEEFVARVGACDVALINELALSRLVFDRSNAGRELLETSRRPMSDAVRRALFLYHYVEFRSEDRTLDNPLNRRDGPAMLMAAADALGHAMRAGLVLEGRTYPYKKWLPRAFGECEVGQACGPHMETLLASLTPDGYARGGPEQQHPASNALRAIRMVLIETAERAGFGGGYLRRWWLHLTQARAARARLRW